ncbi:MAG TPA: ABC-F family ATP-binding cassette domain-containing protein [Chitinophagales bacterium]|nr:ABC-F family ATP-binding cassette domain-containing protein [Chitinophagales bacterium]HQW80090.1 ABC-F family ATP-binding cassette domain-containing protein [Chitinophagales bacterium]HRB66870.1 ABC-F family ATP-binding cassette domain-containing protein [Chitinophagales bacterium]HRB69191.1 ABC-F family ATP-binding cassette domain-containing protein [Chitinophagales bacterium]
MNYLTVNQLCKYYGDKLLFENITFFIDKGQKVALIAKNGTGKSSLIKIFQGLEPPESGDFKFHKDIKVGFLIQEPNFDDNKSVYQTIMHADNPILMASLEYEHALDGIGDLQTAMNKMDELAAWDYEQQMKLILSKFLIHDLDQKVGTMSGGQKKRLALAILLLEQPDLFILDEPTNHLDMDMIEWLEEYLSKNNISLLMITHDRYFLENICNEILELDNGILYKHKGNYSKYLENKELREENQRVNIEKAQNTFRKELEWMRRQPKARTTKAQSRVDNFENVKTAATAKVEDKRVEIEVRMQRLGGKILELHNIQKAYGDRILLDKFSHKFQRGERVGIVGRNGCGKSTLLNIIMGDERYDDGNVVLGETVVFGYYNQKGLQLKADKKVIDVVKDIAEFLPIGKGSLSASQLLERFLFIPSQQHNLVSTLSGGERRRLYLLTILMKNPNFLILDEPTNDLDILTLQVLEDFLMDFKGCLVIVSHDRYFLDKLTDHLFVFEGNGNVRDFLGNYNEYRLQVKEEQKQALRDEKELAEKSNSIKSVSEKKKLSFKEQTELKQLEKDVELLNKNKQVLTEKISTETNHLELEKIAKQIEEIIISLEKKEMRWLELSEYI